MKKTFLRRTCLFMILFALLAPVVLPYLECHEGMEQIELTDQEGKKEHKKELEEKKLFFEQLIAEPSQFSQMQALADSRVMLSYQQIHHEIVLPPPEA